jgi:hypothetical protein
MDITDLSGPPQDSHGIVLLSLFWLIGQGRFLRCARCASCARRVRCGSRPGLAQEGKCRILRTAGMHEPLPNSNASIMPRHAFPLFQAARR